MTMPKTFENQSRLPKLPVPSLDETLVQYARTLRPLLTPDQLKSSAAAIEQFRNGFGRVLQQRLLDRSRTEPTGWLDNWWLQKAYHEYRTAVLINVNWVSIFIDDVNLPQDLVTQSTITSAGGHGKREYTELQVKRAAHLAVRGLQYKERIERWVFV